MSFVLLVFFQTMCSTRKKRATDTAEPNVTVSHFSISVVNPFTQTGDILEFTFKKTSHFSLH